MSELNKCFNCDLDEKIIPLVSIRFDEKKSWVCPQCLPTLIHKREAMQNKLDKLKNSEQ